MCGIAGVMERAGPPDQGLVRDMLTRLPHRGPDGSGIYLDDEVALGHVRLAIVDVGGGAQPMGNEDGSVWVTFNGEIFNYVELREQLRSLGHRFRTASDTEVVVHAWEEWGEDAFGRFNGEWALAIRDRGRRQLVLSRDRMGVKPLFFTRQDGRFLFASEVKAIFADPRVERSWDRVGLLETMTFWSPVAPRTVFTGIEQLPPGHLAVVDDLGVRLTPYWAPAFPARGHEPVQDLAVNVEELRERLIESVRLRFLRSDVPVGAYLSGGIDSSITAAVIARFTDAPLETYSLRFSDPDFDEGAYQNSVARALGTSHSHVVVDAADIGAVFPEVVRQAETPLLRAAPAPMLLLSGLVRERGHKVVVTGEGADEVFAGYDIFKEARLREFIARDPGSATRARALELLYPWMVRSPGRAPAFAREFFGRGLDVDDPAFSHRPRWESTRTLLTMTVPHPDWEHDVVGPVLDRLPSGHGDWDRLSRAQWLEMTTLLPGYILSSQGDRMLMASSVEGRFPFLDPEVVALGARLPARHKLMGVDEKHVLKQAFADLVPPEVVHRPKQPYRSPDASAFFGRPSTTSWVEEATAPERVEAAGIFRPEVVAAVIDKCRLSAGARMSNTDNMRLLMILSTQLVHQIFIAGDGSSAADRPPAGPTTIIDRTTHA